MVKPSSANQRRPVEMQLKGDSRPVHACAERWRRRSGDGGDGGGEIAALLVVGRVASAGGRPSRRRASPAAGASFKSRTREQRSRRRIWRRCRWRRRRGEEASVAAGSRPGSGGRATRRLRQAWPGGGGGSGQRELFPAEVAGFFLTDLAVCFLYVAERKEAGWYLTNTRSQDKYEGGLYRLSLASSVSESDKVLAKCTLFHLFQQHEGGSRLRIPLLAFYFSLPPSRRQPPLSSLQPASS